MSVSAGETPLLNVFKNGVVLVCISEAGGKTLRVLQDSGEADGRGGEGTWAQFRVHVRGPQRVALQNVNVPSYWLRIKDNDFNGKGNDGGPYTEFKLEEHDNSIVFESVQHPGQHIGIVENGDAKKPGSTGTRRHGHFQPKVIHEVKEIITAGSSHYEKLLAHGNIVVLESVASGKSLRVFDDARIDGTGGTGLLAQFIVHVSGENKIKLQCVKHPERWLKIKNDELKVGKGGYLCELRVDSNDGNLVLESVKFPGTHVGVRESGEAKPPNQTGRRKHGQFQVKVIKEQPKYHRAGTSLLERTLHHGNRVVLFSKASGKTLRIRDDKSLEGRGGEGTLAQFIVHVCAPGVVAFQNVNQPSLYLCIKPEELTHGGGSYKSHLKVKDNGKYLLFESVVYPGKHVGVVPDGIVKAPQSTHEGGHGQFTPKVKKDSPFSRPL